MILQEQNISGAVAEAAVFTVRQVVLRLMELVQAASAEAVVEVQALREIHSAEEIIAAVPPQ